MGSKYRGMLEVFYDVEAESEAEAQEKMKALMIERLKDEEPFIVWEQGPIDPLPTHTGRKVAFRRYNTIK